MLRGALAGLIAFAPAAWLATAAASASSGHLLLADARGTVWNGSAVMVLTGGPDSRDASALPGRFEWSVGVRSWALALRMRHACCLNGEITWRLKPGFGRMQVVLEPAPNEGALGQWPAAWLSGLGTPWNTLQLGGLLRLTSPDLQLDWAQGRMRFIGQASLELTGVSSRVSTLNPLGSYRLDVLGGAGGSDAATISLSTMEGALDLSGDGQWSGGRLRFNGEARAAAGSEAALNNLLNIIGRRQGARSVITIG
jgi:general secretion pathway protein N